MTVINERRALENHGEDQDIEKNRKKRKKLSWINLVVDETMLRAVLYQNDSGKMKK